MEKIILSSKESKKSSMNQSKVLILLLILFKIGYSLALPNRVTSAAMNDFDGILPVYGTSTTFRYELLINSDGGSEASSSFVSLSGVSLPAGMSCTFSSNTLFVVNGNEVLLPAYSTGGRIFLNFTTAGIGACFNITPPGSYNGVTFTLTSDPSPVESSSLVIVIAKKNLTVAALFAENKVYDGTTNVSFTGGALSGINCSDDVSFTAAGNFLNANVGTNKAISANFVLTGTHASRYNLIQPNIQANITVKRVDIQIDDLSKCEGSAAVYSNTNFSATGLIGADIVNTITINCPYDTPEEPAGVFQVNGSNPNGSGLSNYYFVFDQGELTIQAKPTISSSTSASRCGAGTLGLDATSSAGDVKWYAASSGGASLHTGTTIITPSLSNTTSYWVEADNGGCVSATRTEIVATISDCSTELTEVSCGATLTSMSQALYSDAVAGATDYRYEVRKQSDNSYVALLTRGANDNLVRLSWSSAIVSNTTYSIKVSAFVGGTWIPYGTACTVTTPVRTKLATASCGVTLVNMSDALYSDAVAGATDYRYEVRKQSDNSYVAVLTRGANDNLVRLSWSSAIVSNTTYSIKVSAFVGGTWIPYGTACTVTTPVRTKLATASCGVTLATMSDALYSDAVAGATDYRYEVRKQSDNSYVTVLTRGANDNLVRLSWSSAIVSNTTYSIKVSAFVGGTWIPYGTACTVTTPVRTKLATASCGVTLATMSDALYSDAVAGATDYRYEVRKQSDNSYVTVLTRGANDNLVRLSWSSAMAFNTTYSIKVSAYVSGAWLPYGTACTVTTPVSGMMTSEQVESHEEPFSLGDLSLETYPNPNDGNFTISFSHEGSFNIINQLGQLIQKVEITKENNYQTKVENLGQGVYFVTGTINNEVITKKVVVQ